MANRRQLKKNVNYIAGELFAECLINTMAVPGIDAEKADKVLADILIMQDDFVSRISHTEPGNVKAFYRNFRESFNEKVNAIIDDIEKLGK